MNPHYEVGLVEAEARAEMTQSTKTTQGWEVVLFIPCNIPRPPTEHILWAGMVDTAGEWV